MPRAHTAVVTYDPVTNTVLTAATVNVYNPGTVTPISATIFDKSGNTLSNPLTSDATTGLIDFYLAVAQEVDLVVSKASFVTRTYSNVPVLDDASNNLTGLLTTTGDMPYASSANTPARLPIAANNSVMYVAAGVPAWTTNLQVNSSGNVGIGIAPISNGSLQVGSGATAIASLAVGISTPATLTAAANSDTLSSVYVNPTFAANSKTSLSAFGIHVPPQSFATTSGTSSGLRIGTITGANANNFGAWIDQPTGAATQNTALCLGAGTTSAAKLTINPTNLLGGLWTIDYGSLANTNTTAALTGATTNTGNSFQGLLFIIARSGTNSGALYYLGGTFNSTALVSSWGSSTFGTSAGASNINVYWDGTKYTLQNSASGTQNFAGIWLPILGNL